MTIEAKIFVRLLDEGVSVWRPVRATHQSDAIYEIVDQPYDRATESWQFAPGDTVMCEERDLGEGPVLVATIAAESAG